MLLHQAKPGDRIELAQDDDRATQRMADHRERQWSRVVERPGGDVHLVPGNETELSEHAEHNDNGNNTGFPNMGRMGGNGQGSFPMGGVSGPRNGGRSGGAGPP